MFKFMHISNQMQKAHLRIDTPHHYLWIIGTGEESQGHGLGRTVISEMLRKCDDDGIVAYLESSNKKNIPFYQRHGFTIIEEIPNLPKGCPPVTTMIRKPYRDV